MKLAISHQQAIGIHREISDSEIDLKFQKTLPWS
jgi:hypothetical protein